MAYIDYTRSHSGCPYETTLCLTAGECNILLPVVKKALSAKEKIFDKYKDIHESGEATERQQNLLMQAEDDVATLRSIIQEIETYLTN